MISPIEQAVGYYRGRVAARALREDGTRGDPRWLRDDVDEESLRFAAHEAAHAVAFLALGLRVHEVTVDPKRSGQFHEYAPGPPSRHVIVASADRTGVCHPVRACAPREVHLVIALAPVAAGDDADNTGADRQMCARLGVHTAAQAEPYVARARLVLAQNRLEWFKLTAELYERGTLWARDVAEVVA